MIPRRDPGFPGRNIGVFTAVAVALVVIMLATVELVGEGHEAEGAEEGGERAATEPAEGGEGDAAAGETVFVGELRQLPHARRSRHERRGGPESRRLHPDLDGVVEQVTNGGGAMPAFGGQLSEEEIQNVAEFVVAAQG